MRVMLVDTACPSLENVRQQLADSGRSWELVHARDNRDALAQAERGMDAIVADLGSPAAASLELLRMMRLRHPEVIRLALTDIEHREMAVRAMDIAHQCMERPCDTLLMSEAIERAVALRHLLDSRELRRVIGQVERLPSAPRMYMRLRGVLGDSECGARSVCELLDQDPALTAKVLQMANSALFSGGAQLHSVHQALMRIGMDTLRIAVLANEVFDAHHGPKLAVLRRRAVRAAQLAAGMAPPRERDLARTAALLAEVGLLVPGVEALCAAEVGRSTSPPTPTHVGAYLLGLWGLPSSMVEAVAHHRQPSRVAQTHFGVLGIVHVATALARGEAPDADYVTTMGLSDRVATWTRRAADLGDLEEDL